MAFLRKKALWRVKEEQITLGVRTHLIGRIELSKFRGAQGKTEPYAVLDAARAMEEGAADIVELNAGPPRLKRDIPSHDEELGSLVPVLRRMASRIAIPISVTTANAETARRAADLGASIIHDYTGLAYDVTLAAVVNQTGAGLILGHMRGTPSQWPRLVPLNRLVETVRTDLRASVLRASQAGIEPRRIVLEPGLEQGKRGNENFRLLRAIAKLAPPEMGFSVNLSRKRFLVESIQASASERQAALAVAATLAVESGAHMLTVEQPEALRTTVAVIDRIYRADEQFEMAGDYARSV